jgi:hypothetical protein
VRARDETTGSVTNVIALYAPQSVEQAKDEGRVPFFFGRLDSTKGLAWKKFTPEARAGTNLAPRVFVACRNMVALDALDDPMQAQRSAWVACVAVTKRARGENRKGFCFVTETHTNGKYRLRVADFVDDETRPTLQQRCIILRCARYRSDVAPTMSDERAPLSRLFHTEDSRARVNCADGVPEHLRDHLRVPDKEVFVLQARLLALQTALASTESDRDEALRVAADATARCDSFEERAASRLDKARTRAATAERAAEASERRADEGERQVAVLERRVGEVEASLVATRGVAEGARFRLETKVTQNASLEVDITVLHQRVRLLERGVLSVSFGTQTAAEDFAAAARANDADKVLPAAVGVRANAKRWLQELQAVGAPPSVDTVSGLPLRANARHHLTPPGLGTDLVPPSAPDKGAAGYTKAHAVRVRIAFPKSQDCVPVQD